MADKTTQLSFILGCVYVTLTLIAYAQAQSPSSSSKSICSKVTCNKAPEGLQCTMTIIKNPSVLRKVGMMKDCCPAWRCQEPDGSYSTYFGMSGNQAKRKKQMVGRDGDDENDDFEDNCSLAKATCPVPEGLDSCSITVSKDAMAFKPKGELDSCCPIYNCTSPDDTFRLQYLMRGGKQPKRPETIAREKGKPTGRSRCPKVQCAERPQAADDGPTCSASMSDDSPRILSLGPFRECCDLWKCVYLDGSYYTHFELQAPSFWVAETAFQSARDGDIDDDDDVPIAMASDDVYLTDDDDDDFTNRRRRGPRRFVKAKKNGRNNVINIKVINADSTRDPSTISGTTIVRNSDPGYTGGSGYSSYSSGSGVGMAGMMQTGYPGFGMQHQQMGVHTMPGMGAVPGFGMQQQLPGIQQQMIAGR